MGSSSFLIPTYLYLMAFLKLIMDGDYFLNYVSQDVDV